MLKVSNLKVSDDKSMGLIVRSLALEAHSFALARGIPSKSVDHQLGLVFGVLSRHFSHLLDIIDVPARGASCLAALEVRFSDEGYLFLTQATKDRVAGIVDADA